MGASIDTSRLTRDQKLELIQLLEEKARRERDRKPHFKERASTEQLTVLGCPDTERYVFAGNGSGKTAVGCEDLRCAVTGVNPYTGQTTPVPCRAFIILDKPDKLETVIIPELRKWMVIRPDQLHKKGKPYISLITLDNGSSIRPIFWDQDSMTAEGIEGDYFWFDEPPPRALYISLKRAGRTKGSKPRYLFTGTPLAAPWLRTEVYESWTKGERKDTTCFRFDTESNRRNLKDGYIEEFSAVLSEKERGIRLRGEFFDLDGLALSHLFKRTSHTIRRDQLQWDERNPCVIVIDPHPSKAHHAIVMGVDREDRLYVLEEYKEKAVARKFAKSLIGLNWFSTYRILDIVYDSLGSSEMTSGEGFKPFGEVINEVFTQHGLGRGRATSYNEKSDEDFIERIQDGLVMPTEPDSFGQLVPQLRVLSHCVGTIGDIENVQWKRDKAMDQNKPSLEISNKDFLSCVKYALACNLNFKKKKDKAYFIKKDVYGLSLQQKRQAQYQTLRMKRPAQRGRGKPDDESDW